jgi:type I restriction enzyme S subunit
MIADRLRAAILRAAISGKLTDQRPEDGTATDLLEQIAV